MTIPAISWDEGSPTGQQGLALMGVRIRELKTQIREIISVDHIMSSSGSGATWGYHKKLTFYTQDSDSLPDDNTGVLYAKDVDDICELYWVDEDDNEMQLTSNGQFVGGMVDEVRIYSGLLADIPSGWALATALTGKFIRGVATGATEPGGSGGSDSRTLVEANITAHTHTLTDPTGYYSFHKHTVLVGTGTGGSSTYLVPGITPFTVIATTGTTKTGAHTHTLVSAGSSTAYNNRPAYIEEAFIVKI